MSPVEDFQLSPNNDWKYKQLDLVYGLIPERLSWIRSSVVGTSIIVVTLGNVDQYTDRKIGAIRMEPSANKVHISYMMDFKEVPVVDGKLTVAVYDSGNINVDFTFLYTKV
jgi:hypothetical protein